MNIIESNFNFGALNKRSSTNKIITHHADAITCTVLDINQWHKNNGWAGIGYHFLIKKDGSAYAGRPIDTVGAHTLGQNSDSIGICLEGRLTQEKPTNEQIQSLEELISYLKGVYGNIPVKGHMDYMETDCPGSLMDYINELNGCSNGVCPIPTEQTQSVEKKTWEYYIDGNLVRNLQHELNIQFGFNLDEDGYLGTESLKALKGIFIKQGARGNITKIIQERLLQLGYSLPRFGADSDFGTETANALYRFQLDRGLVPDIIVGVNTFKELFRK